MARPRLPTKIKLLHGETRPSRLNHTEPRPRAQLPKLPSGLGVGAAVVWRRVIREFGHAGVLTAVDSDILRAYCESVARYESAGAMLDASGPLVRGVRGHELVKNPLHQIVRDNAVLVRSLARELGLTPSARAGLHATPEPLERDPFAILLERGPYG